MTEAAGLRHNGYEEQDIKALEGVAVKRKPADAKRSHSFLRS